MTRDSLPFLQPTAIARQIPCSLPDGLRPKIGIVTHYMPPHIGGIEILADALFRAYLSAGCEVRWIASRVPVTSAEHEDGRIRVNCLNWLEPFGIPWPIWGPAAVKKVRELVKWADVLHVHDCLYLGSILSVYLGSRFNKPVILTQHIGFVHYSQAFFNLIERLAYEIIGKKVLREATSIVLATPSAQEFVSDLLNGLLGFSKNIPNGIDTDRFQPATMRERQEARKKLEVPQAAGVVLLVGRLVEKKGVDLFYEVSRRLREYHFLLVGDGPLQPPKMRNLTWMPFVPPEQMHLVYQAADVFMLPSHGEGFPVAVHEAMATGLPVLVSKEEPFALLLDQEKACIAVERTALSMSNAIMEIFNNAELAIFVGKRSRELVLREWSLESMAQKYINLIDELVI